MPTYEYACTSCGDHLEVVQSFRDDALTTCPNCGGTLRKVFGSIGVVFKGSGFYKTDSRPASKSASSSSSSTETKSAESTSTSSGAKKTETSSDSSTGSSGSSGSSSSTAAAS